MKPEASQGGCIHKQQVEEYYTRIVCIIVCILPPKSHICNDHGVM